MRKHSHLKVHLVAVVVLSAKVYPLIIFSMTVMYKSAITMEWELAI